MVQFEDVTADRPVSGAGVGNMIEEEEQVGRGVDATPGPSSSAGPWEDEASP